MQRIHVVSSKSQSRALTGIPEGTTFGLVIEVQIVKIANQYGLELAIPSPNDRERTSYVLISRGKCRFGDEIHVPNAELRSSAELLSELQKSEGGEPCLTKTKTGNQETGAVHVTSPTGIKQTCADTLSISPSQASFFAQRTIPTTERKWTVFPASSSYGGALPIAVSKMVSRMVRHYDQDERQTVASLHWDTLRLVLLKAFAKHGARDFLDEQWLRLIHEGSSKTRFECREDSKNSLAYFRSIPGHSGGIPIDPELIGVRSNSLQLERVNLSQWLFFQHPIYPWERTDSVWKGKRQRTADYLLHTTLPFTPMKKNPVMITLET